MELSTLAIALLSIALTYYFLISPKRRSGGKLPPGPRPLPVVGNIFQLGTKPHQSLAQLAKTHGPLMSLHFGSVYTVIVTSPEMAREIFVKHDTDFLNRTVVEAVHAHDHDSISMAFMDVGAEWRALRRICKEQIFSVKSLETSQVLRQEKLHQLRSYVQRCSEGGRVVDIREASFVTTLNLMSATLFSIQATEFDSTATEEFREIMEGVASIVGDPNFADYFPILKRFDPQGVKRKAELYFGKMLVLVEDLLKKRQEERRRDPAYVKKSDLLEKLVDVLNEESEYKLTTKHITHLLLDLFVGGSETTTTSVEWIMSELLINPEKLEKLKEELRRVVGEKNQVQESDIPRLPYFEAVMKEVFRLHPPGPLLLPRKAEREVQIGGYTIPKDTQILVNAWAIGRDPSIWPNPEAFEPERFLSMKMDYKGQDFELIPFGSGKRICPGLSFANRMLPMMVATLIHNFNWKLEVEANAQDVHKGEMFGIAVRRAVPLKAYPHSH
ncbi:ferruginol synthase-like [Salvia splendens]|uniref:ferruginol synthase-like n=1 Tax=Salvia splendens TaxID=180675 RepID=UPI001C2545E5|nr:ferruginol synthase-like [Salvia splendens]WCR39976.1 ferruginol synthase CYP4 [Salvia splendens]